jgi:hypothetical protein
VTSQREDPSANPYASPQTDAYEQPAPQVGVWQDGEYLVMHLGAALPPICVKSGQPAERYSAVTIRWVQIFVPWRSTIAVPLTWAAYRKAMFAPVVIFVGTLAATVAMVGVAARFDDEPILLILLVAALAVATIVTGLRALNALGTVLRVSRSRGKHLWLSGAGPEFLKQLPKWEDLPQPRRGAS